MSGDAGVDGPRVKAATLPGMLRRPVFDPREELRVEILDLGECTASTRDAAGNWVTRQQRNLGLNVFLDGNERISCSERIDGQLPIGGEDTLVAFHACGCCGLWECNLTEGYAARVRRLGPYVLWVTCWDEVHCFSLDRYREIFGGHPERLPELSEEDFWDLRDPLASGAYSSLSGRRLSFDCDSPPENPFQALRSWPTPAPVAFEAVAPPSTALEIRSLVEGDPSLWIGEPPDAPGRKAAFLPGIFRLPVWITGPLVDPLIALILED